MTEKIPISIYIHIPFCVQKCRYCDFLSSAVSEDKRSSYIMALCNEISQDIDTDKYIVNTIFIGGGTPSILDVSDIEKILCKLKEKYDFIARPEITIECNPGTLDVEKLLGYKGIGINRISMGAQSFNDDELKLLGRIHSAYDIKKSVEDAKNAGFSNINLDLISSIPYQTEEKFKKTLKAALDLDCAHYSVYSLIVEPGTWMYENQGKLDFPSEETECAIDDATKVMLTNKGYRHYEISNYAKEGYECRHNLTYWQRGMYRGYGLGAASLLIDENGNEFRFSAEQKMDDYIKDSIKTIKLRDKCEEFRVLSEADIRAEYMFLGLRLTEGIPIENYKKYYKSLIDKHIKEGLCRLYDRGGKEYYSLTEKGLKLANYVMSDYC